jgi:prevent-host-death family protein
MNTVGIREMKNRLSDYVRRARLGEVILVTDRGRVVARLTPPAGNDTDDDALDRLEADGLLSGRGSAHRPDPYGGLTPLVPAGTTLDLLDDLRNER